MLLHLKYHDGMVAAMGSLRAKGVSDDRPCRLRFGERVVIARGGIREGEEYQLTQIVVQIDDKSKPEEAAAQIRATIKPFHQNDLVGVTVGGLKMERPPIERKPSQEPPK